MATSVHEPRARSTRGRRILRGIERAPRQLLGRRARLAKVVLGDAADPLELEELLHCSAPPSPVPESSGATPTGPSNRFASTQLPMAQGLLSTAPTAPSQMPLTSQPASGFATVPHTPSPQGPVASPPESTMPSEVPPPLLLLHATAMAAVAPATTRRRRRVGWGGDFR